METYWLYTGESNLEFVNRDNLSTLYMTTDETVVFDWETKEHYRVRDGRVYVLRVR